MNLIGVLNLGVGEGGGRSSREEKRTQTESKMGPSEFLLVVHVPYYEESVILAAPSKVASSNDW